MSVLILKEEVNDANTLGFVYAGLWPERIVAIKNVILVWVCVSLSISRHKRTLHYTLVAIESEM